MLISRSARWTELLVSKTALTCMSSLRARLSMGATRMSGMRAEKQGIASVCLFISVEERFGRLLRKVQNLLHTPSDDLIRIVNRFLGDGWNLELIQKTR